MKTVCFFDVMEYPMTSFEIWKWLYSPGVEFAFSDIQKTIDALISTGALEARELFFTLPGRGSLVSMRKERYLVAHEKYKKALKSIRLLAKIPWIRGIAICNNLAFSNAGEDADIDLFILVDPGHIWKTRLFASGLMATLRRRPQKHKKKDSICLSFFVSPDGYDLSEIAIQDDVYLMYWVAGLVPVYQKNNAFDDFFTVNNWVSHRLPHWEFPETSSRRSVFVSFELPRLYDGASLETVVSILQKRRLNQALVHAMNNADGGVILGDCMIKLHAADARTYYREEYLSRIGACGIGP